ncbi:hypothetical protein [Formosa sp. S-31]|uniref:hypothetical protein n=1 Tax=Formosa sp. S-31 TaxID=2790949 RepID=UPI003EBCAB58
MSTSNTLQDFYNSLLSNLYIELLFFVSDAEHTRLIIDKIEAFKDMNFYKEAYIIDYFKGPVPYNRAETNFVLQKPIKLEENIFKLLRAKHEVSEFEFNYILDKYFEQVDCVCYICHWLLENLHIIQNDQSEMQNLFNLQHVYYKKHFETLIKQFYKDESVIPYSNYNKSKQLEASIFDFIKGESKGNTAPKFPALLGQDVSETNVAKPNVLATTSEKGPKKRSKKEPLITEKVAEKELLRSIFNIG